jgi:hypothetical protein
MQKTLDTLEMTTNFLAVTSGNSLKNEELITQMKQCRLHVNVPSNSLYQCTAPTQLLVVVDAECKIE